MHEQLNRFLRQGVTEGFLAQKIWELLTQTLATPRPAIAPAKPNAVRQ
jgi:hypothetical protein